MKIVANYKKIERNRKIGLFTSLGSLLVLVVGFILSFQSPDMLNLAYLALLIGLIMSQVGIYFGNRWGRSPRIDERLTSGLKGLDDRYTLYHYTGPVPHMLIGPAGIWVIVPQHQPGQITYEKNRFRQKGVFFLNRFFAQEGIGRPELEAAAFAQDVEKFLSKNLNGEQVPSVKPAIVFINPKADVQVSDVPVPTMHLEKLKEFVRRKAKEHTLPTMQIQAVEKILPDESTE